MAQLTDTELNDILSDMDVNTLMYDGLSAACLGVTADEPERLVYSIAESVLALQANSDMTQEEAEEFFWFHVHGVHMGGQTPLFIYDIEDFVCQ